ncbi:uncharacterized protein LOC116030125 isoform X2 [Ipomoea triloba]|uniref:uncharacterized protein LOC116030125 isoform X2 n=1 Tax=Ipomoea triloba TaxID=35885 RepID=UPI00125D2AE5|nr:uncharacterized protein LOC116030125 isoform X2 [Ipomoea triloba]
MAYRTTTCRQDDDGMVDCELEAAEALAGLAHSALPSRSTASDASESPANSRSPPPPNEDHETLPPRHNIENPLPNILGSGNEFEISPSLTCSFDYPSVIGSKSRQNITEVEKEARRLRRVLANRESARQTIRRRQAMYEELTKKAADLALENENLKKEKELAAKEYDCLKSTNNSLKAQMTSVVKEEAQDIHEVSNSTQPEMSTAPSFFYNRSPMMPCMWRPIFQPLDAIHLQHGSQSGFSSNVGEPTPFLKQEHSTSNPATPFYVLPFPWLLPFHAPNPYFPQSSDHNETSVLHQCSMSSSITPVSMEQHRIFLPVKDEMEDSNSTQAIHKDDCKEVGLGFLSGLGTSCTTDGIRQHLEPHPKQAAALMAGAKVGSLGGEVRDINTISSSNVRQITRDSFEDKGVLTCPSKNSAEATAAIEARKRRKEIMKLKNHLHCRPCHMH